MSERMDYLNLKTCDRCGRLYETFLEVNYCQSCLKFMEEKLDAVRQFLKVNDTASLEEVEIALKVSRKDLIGWIRENRLEFPEPSGVTVPCQKCEQPIKSGRFCPICRADIMEKLDSVYEKPEKKRSVRVNALEGNKMHFLNRRKR